MNEDLPSVTKTDRFVILVHGFGENAQISPLLTSGRQAYQNQGWNVIVVDWSGGSSLPSYWQSAANVRTVGAMIGQLVVKWNIISQTRLVGYSLGGQIIGEAGRYVQNMSNGHKIPSCHGLDPAGPFYTGCSGIELGPSDCDLVEVIHSSAEPIPTLSLVTLRLGSATKMGHCDYWVNCGYNQGLCQVMSSTMIFFSLKLPDLNSKIDGLLDRLVPTLNHVINLDYKVTTEVIRMAECDHSRAILVYISQIEGNCNYRVHPCPDCGQAPVCHPNLNITAGHGLPPNSKCEANQGHRDFYVKSYNSADKHYCDE